MKLVEIIRGYRTSDETCEAIMNASQALGKVPVEVNDTQDLLRTEFLCL